MVRAALKATFALSCLLALAAPAAAGTYTYAELVNTIDTFTDAAGHTWHFTDLDPFPSLATGATVVAFRARYDTVDGAPATGSAVFTVSGAGVLRRIGGTGDYFVLSSDANDDATVHDVIDLDISHQASVNAHGQASFMVELRTNPASPRGSVRIDAALVGDGGPPVLASSPAAIDIIGVTSVNDAGAVAYTAVVHNFGYHVLRVWTPADDGLVNTLFVSLLLVGAQINNQGVVVAKFADGGLYTFPTTGGLGPSTLVAGADGNPFDVPADTFNINGAGTVEYATGAAIFTTGPGGPVNQSVGYSLDFGTRMALDDAGNVAFQAIQLGTGAYGVFFGPPASPSVPAPPRDPVVYFGQVLTPTNGGLPFFADAVDFGRGLDNAGQVAFRAGTRGGRGDPSFAPSNTVALFLATPACVPTTCAALAACGSVPDGCGGTLTCNPCQGTKPKGARCASASECASGVCTATTPGSTAQAYCRAPVCNDGVKNGDESDQDCGGVCGGPFNECCARCAIGKHCTAGTDCSSRVCGSDGTCQSPTCSDGVKNGNESGIDCGGSCAGCPTGSRCSVGADCLSGVCTPSILGAPASCRAPACNDGVRNGNETGVDCGGSCHSCATP